MSPTQATDNPYGTSSPAASAGAAPASAIAVASRIARLTARNLVAGGGVVAAPMGGGVGVWPCVGGGGPVGAGAGLWPFVVVGPPPCGPPPARGRAAAPP